MKAADYRSLNIPLHWVSSGDDALLAARLCGSQQRWRSAVNRSYYAAYSYLASVLATEGIDFRGDRVGPEHEPLPDLIRDHLRNRFKDRELRQLRLGVTELYGLRISADYRPHDVMGEATALKAIKLASSVRNILERMFL